LALLLANVRYWFLVAPLTRVQLERWETRARTIPDPLPRELATSKLCEERFNVELAATFATLAKPSHRRDAVEAIVALQVAYDYLDRLTEEQSGVPGDPGTRLLEALVDAVRPERPLEAEHEQNPPQQYDAYVRELVATTRSALAKLPAKDAVARTAVQCAQRCAEAQTLTHLGGHSQLEAWGARDAGSTLQWQEKLAGGAASVLSLHALIAAATDIHTTSDDAEAIDAAYRSICAFTMLDSLVDRNHDIATGELNYVDLYGSGEQMCAQLAHIARDGTSKIQTLPHAPHHLVTLVGIIAYYTSALSPRSTFPPSTTKPIRDEFKPLMGPTLAVLRGWRLAKHLRAR
jgi:tetraprenyl-beta-curcumene synthase